MVSREHERSAKMKRGDVVRLGGRHRLMCGDSGDPDDVRRLFGERKPELVFTSPPYAQQRDYKSKILDWDSLMQRTFGALPHHERTQVLVNLGLVHRKGEWVPYWDGWIKWMRAAGWRRFGWYAWDKTFGYPMDPRIGRPNRALEFVFHFNAAAIPINKTIHSKRAGDIITGTGITQANGTQRRIVGEGKPVQDYKIADDVFRIPPHMARKGIENDHPAVFPIALPAEIIKA